MCVVLRSSACSFHPLHVSVNPLNHALFFSPGFICFSQDLAFSTIDLRSALTHREKACPLSGNLIRSERWEINGLLCRISPTWSFLQRHGGPLCGGHLFLHFVPGMFGPALPPAGVITQGCFTAIHFRDLKIKLNFPHSFIGHWGDKHAVPLHTCTCCCLQWCPDPLLSDVRQTIQRVQGYGWA